MTTVAEWVAALRSGKYSQTTGTLRDEVGFCCLGVACDLSDPEGWVDIGQPEFRFVYNREDSQLQERSYLPPHIREQLGVNNLLEITLVEMNDNGKSFEEIADYIEGAFTNE